MTLGKESNLRNEWGGERAVCPKCAVPNSELYEFLEDDARGLECSECHQESPFLQYFPKTCDAVFRGEINEFSNWRPHR